jgi:hypothetical protein
VTVERMAEMIRIQSRACHALGSPFYGVLLDLVADDVLADGPAASVLAGHEEDPGPSALALRLAGSVHRLVLQGEAPDLAAHYPSAGGDGDAAAAWPAFRSLLASRPLEVAAGLRNAPQTNEVGRAAALFGALLQIAGLEPLPVRLAEIGVAGGLNLRADRFRYRTSDGSVWGPLSPVELDPAWTSRPVEARVMLRVVERSGADLAPIDPTTEDGAALLASYVWPDQIDRMRRLRGAILVAREYPARLETATAGDFVDTLRVADGHLTVLWHSVMWQYLDAAEKSRVRDRLDEIGSSATPSAPFAHIAFEPRRLEPGGARRFVVAVRMWPGGQERLLGEAPPHGIPVQWGPVGPDEPSLSDETRSPAADGPQWPEADG